MMNQESEIHGLLLSIVIGNKQDGLAFLYQITKSKHGTDNGPLMFVPTTLDGLFFRSMKHKMDPYNFCLLEHLDIKFHVEYFFEESNLLRCIKSLEIILALCNERQSLIPILD